MPKNCICVIWRIEGNAKISLFYGSIWLKFTKVPEKFRLMCRAPQARKIWNFGHLDYKIQTYKTREKITIFFQGRALRTPPPRRLP